VAVLTVQFECCILLKTLSWIMSTRSSG
jgi:hypothetical protein